MQIINEAVGQLIASKLDVDQGYVRAVFGDQTFCFGHSWSRASNIRSQVHQQSFQGCADVPGVLDQEHANASEVQ